MKRHREREITTITAIIKDFDAVPDTRLKLRVSQAVGREGNFVEVSAPFDAFTEDRVKKLCGTNGVMLTCGLIVPWECLEDHRRLVIVRRPLDRMSGLSTVLLNSLLLNSLVSTGLRRIR